VFGRYPKKGLLSLILTHRLPYNNSTLNKYNLLINIYVKVSDYSKTLMQHENGSKEVFKDALEIIKYR